jgi:hypothetical protein
MVKIKYLPLGVIETEGMQIRVKIDPDVVLDYAEAMKAGKKFPPLLLFFDGEKYYLADGFHRLNAARELKVVKIACEARDGTRTDARLAACGANKDHGLQRSSADKRRAVQVALELKPEWSNRMIAEHVGVEHHLVGELRQLGESPSSSVRIARQLKDFGPPPTRERRIGRDGKFRGVPASRPPVPVKSRAETPAANADAAPVAGELAGAAEPEIPGTSASASAAPSADAKAMADRTADKAAGDDPAALVDCLGRHVPADLAPLWHRRQEVQEVLTALSRVKSTLRRAQDGQDPLWAEVNFSSVLILLDKADTEIAVTKPFAVCPMCQGIGCRACKARGLIGKFRYDTVIPRELKVKAPQRGA